LNTQNYIGIKKNRPLNFVVFSPKQKFVRAEIKVNDSERWTNKLEEHDFELTSIGKRSRRIKFRLTKKDLESKRELLKELFQTLYNERTT
jgi:hypothetical protein